MIGRELHKTRATRDKDFLRKRLGVKRKLVDVELTSAVLHLKGIVDEVLFLEDGTAAPLDYKFAKWRGHIYRPLFYQSMIYATLIEELFSLHAPKGFIVYTRSANHIQPVEYPKDKRGRVKQMVREVLSIIQGPIYPEGKPTKAKCADCTYAKLCIK